jgi:acyl transferase domain-containing protein
MKQHATQIITTVNATPNQPLVCFRFAAESGASLVRRLKDSIGRTDQLFSGHDRRIQRDNSQSASPAFHFTSEDAFRSTILAASAEQLRGRLAVAVKAAEEGKFRTLLDRDRVILWQTQPEASRVAWLFPGQGSHYTETPSVFSACDVACRTLAAVDDFYAAGKLPRLSTVFGNAAIRPGEDVWWAQAWVLGVSAALIETLKAQGLRPDAVLGHSFGRQLN